MYGNEDDDPMGSFNEKLKERNVFRFQHSDKNNYWIGMITTWYENGQKKSEVTYKDREKDGLYTEWYENGQKKRERFYINGKLILKK